MPRRRQTRVREQLNLHTVWSEARDRANAQAAGAHDSYCEDRHGWLLESSLDDVLQPLLSSGGGDDDHFTLQPFDASVAATLIERLPASYLAEERQNDGPTIGSVLSAIMRHPTELQAFGYVIGPGRCDERITVEGALVRLDREFTLCSPYEPSPVADCECQELYAVLVDDFKIDDARVFPHELGRWFGGDQNFWYRLWWD